MEARIIGEVHGYDDFRSALDEPLSSYDALLVEGRDDDGMMANLSTGYTVFLMGYIPVMQMNSGEDLESDAREAGVDYHNDIDADVHTIYYEMTSPLIRTLSLLFLATALLVWLLLVPDMIDILSLPDPTVIFGIYLVCLVSIFALPMAFTSFIAAIAPGSLYGGLRDDYMTEQVDSIAEENGYERVVIRCGQAHVTGIGEELKEKGWEVDLQRSQSLFGKLIRLASVPFAIFCRVLGAVILRLPGGKPPYLKNSD